MPDINKTPETNQASLTEQPPTKEVTKTESRTLTPIQQVQTDVIKFTRKKLGEERAAEFATGVALLAKENQKLRQAIERNPDSFLTAYLASAKLDLMPNTPEAHAYIIPYGDNVQFQTGYKGLIKLARRSGEIKTINAELVFKGDEFDVEFGTERKIVHKPSFSVDRTDYKLVTHAYATARLSNGEDVFVVMTRNELDKVRNTVKAKSTDAPWQTWPERMALKTVLKRLTQLLPSGTDDSLSRAVVMDSWSEVGKLRLNKQTGEIIEGELVELSNETLDAINNAESRDDLRKINENLTVAERKKAVTFINEKMKALA